MSIDSLREEAFAHHERGEFAAAERGYREVLKHAPGDLEILHALGLLATQTGRFGDAVDLMRRVARERASAAVHADLGNALCALSRFEEALLSYDLAIGMQAHFADAHLNRGAALRLLGRHAEALADCDCAIKARPEFYEAHLGRADVLRELGRAAEALASYERAVGLRPDRPLAYLKQAAALLEVERHADALQSVDRAIALGIDSAEARNLRGQAQAGLGLDEAAMTSYEAAIARDPRYAPAYINRGVMLRNAGRASDALASYDAALALDAHSFEGFCNRAAALADLNRAAEALLDCDRARALRPERPETHFFRATILLSLDRFEESLADYEQAIALRADYAEAHAGRSAALQYLGRHGEALASAERAVALAPHLGAGHFNRAAALRDLTRIEEAVRSFATARSLMPEDPEAHCNLGGLHLLLGRYELGWPLYEWRARLPGAPRFHRYSQRPWDGAADLAGQTLFVYLDQGLGDTIQFSRFAKLAEMRGACVVMAVQDRLRRLMSTLSPSIRILGEAEEPAAFDCHCPLASLPGAFKTTLATIPNGVPYLSAEPNRIAHWRDRLGEEGFKIGVSWQGSTLKTGIGRSFPLGDLLAISRMPSIRLINLQRGVGSEQLRNLPAGMAVESLGEDFDNGADAFIDTAAVMHCLDLVITCDTSIAHLAGALGRVAWVALKRVPDWRWGLDRADSPWYPSLRLFRQRTAGDWSEVFAAMQRELHPLIHR